MRAVVCTGPNEIAVEDVELDSPRAGEIRVRMAATGVCHSDLSACNGTLPQPLPLALGHEGAGVVDEVGPGVTRLRPGDAVVLSFIPSCGECFHCVRGEVHLCSALAPGGRQLDGSCRLRWKGAELPAFMSLGCMAEYAVVPAISAVPIAQNLPLTAAALVGCGFTTGVGAALKTAKVRPGSSVAVFGCGGVGLSVIQGARLAGAERIIAVDLAPAKLELAQRFGATHALDAGAGELIPRVQALTDGRGVDYAFEAVGVPKLVEQAYRCTRRGGTLTVVGVGRFTERIQLNALMFPLEGKTVHGCMYGNVNPREDFPKLLALCQRGALDVEGLVTRTYGIEQAPQAFRDLEAGANARGVIAFN